MRTSELEDTPHASSFNSTHPGRVYDGQRQSRGGNYGGISGDDDWRHPVSTPLFAIYSIVIALPTDSPKQSKEVHETRTVNSFAGFLLSEQALSHSSKPLDYVTRKVTMRHD